MRRATALIVRMTLDSMVRAEIIAIIMIPVVMLGGMVTW